MGLLDSILSGVLNNQQAGQAPPMPPQSMLQNVLALLQNQNVGGLSGLIQKFERAGLGHVVSGWVSNGPNPPVSADQVHAALGDQPVQQFAQQSGMSFADAKNVLAQMLPHMVDHLTPNGNVPSQGVDWTSALTSLQSKFMH